MQWLALAVVLFAGASLVYFTLRTGISPMPSHRLQRAAVLEAIGDTAGPIYELGAGWGSLAFPLADRFPHAPVIAFELSWIPFAVMRVRQLLRPRKNLTLRRADFLQAPLSEAQLLVCYLFRGGMEALKEKLEREAAEPPVHPERGRGTRADLLLGPRLVTHTFSVHGWTPEAKQTLGDLYRTRVYVYRLPVASAASANSRGH